MQKIIHIENGVIRNPQWRMKDPINLTVYEGEQVAIIGDNASGKSRLVSVLTQQYPLMPLNPIAYDFSPSTQKLASENIKFISFQDAYKATDSGGYYQQRWNQHDIAEDTPTVGEILNQAFAQAQQKIGYGMDPEQRAELLEQHTTLRARIYEIFHLQEMEHKYMLSLSSGETRKMQLTQTLLLCPRVLILDNPFIGLDCTTRQLVRELLQRITQEMHLLIILVLNRADEIPPFITHIVPVKDLTVLPKIPKEEYLSQSVSVQPLSDEAKELLTQLPEKDFTQEDFYNQAQGRIAYFDHVSIRYGERTILDTLQWTVNEGERWALSGENGAGKSTLLSLVCADNPQAYACKIHLFGHKRGSGESIWQIKKHIGYISPELHRAYLKDLPAIDVVASGLSDSVGLYFRPSASQRVICTTWMKIFGIEHLAETSFLKMSSGEQRLCLLARAFVKDPELLILDEPFHGLDETNRQRVREIIRLFCQRKCKTMIMVTHYPEELPDCITHHLTLKKRG